VEPGRLEVRVNNFYKKLIEITASETKVGAPEPFPPLPIAPKLQSDPSPDVYGSSIGLSSNNYSYSRESLRMESYPVVPLSDDNIGHQLLGKMGWNEGTGLGADGGGIIEPIREIGKKDKSGVGAGLDPEAIRGTDFASYRNKLSSDYHTKISDREATR